MAHREAEKPAVEAIPQAHRETTGVSAGWRAANSAMRLGICLTLGMTVTLTTALTGSRELAPLLGWDAAAALFVGWLTALISQADQPTTARLAATEDSAGPIADLVLLGAAVTSLVGVGVLLVQGAAKGGPNPTEAITVSVSTVVLSWAVVHLIFTMGYARLYYTGQPGGISFNQTQPPRYLDFAYLAFTVGMTFQISDTDLQDSRIRATVLRQALLSYLFGAVILATTINLIAGLAR